MSCMLLWESQFLLDLDWHGVWLLVATPIARRQDRPEEAKDMPALPLTVLMLACIPKKGMSYAL